MVCLDTSFVIDLLRGKEEVRSLKEELDRMETTIFLTTPTVMELWSGACLSQAPEREKEKINALWHSFSILPVDKESAQEAGEIEAELIQKGQIIETEDLFIAGIARSRGEKVVTRDEHFARIKGLKVWKY